MKSLLALLLMFTGLGKVQAEPGMYWFNWISDSDSAFDVILSGNGPGWSGTLTSPSGLWQVDLDDIVEYPGGLKGQKGLFVGTGAIATYLGSLPAGFPAPDSSASSPFNAASLATWGDYPTSAGNPLTTGYLGKHGWSGSSWITITSMPDMGEIGTWTWKAEYEASGPALVPEPKTISILAMAVAVGIAFRRLKRRKPAGPVAQIA